MKVTKKSAAKFWEMCRNLELQGYELIAQKPGSERQISTFPTGPEPEFIPYTVKVKVTQYLIDLLSSVMAEIRVITAQEAIEHCFAVCAERIRVNEWYGLQGFKPCSGRVLYSLKVKVNKQMNEEIAILTKHWNLNDIKDVVLYATRVIDLDINNMQSETKIESSRLDY